MCSCHSTLECYNLFSGVKLSIRSFCFSISYVSLFMNNGNVQVSPKNKIKSKNVEQT